MSRLQFSPAARSYLERHAVDLDIAHKLGVRSDRDDILYEYTRPLGGSFTRRRDLAGKITKQPSGEPLILYWPAGRLEPGSDVLLCEGEPDALAAVSALDGHPITVAALPGTETPADRVTAELATARVVYLALDGDRPGRDAADRFARSLQEFTKLKVVRVGNGEDLASRLYREEDRAGWLQSALEDAKDAPKKALKDEPQGYRRRKADATRDLLARGIDPDRIDLGGLLDEIRDFTRSYVVLPAIVKNDTTYRDVVANVLALWVAHTWAFDACWATPYLRVVSAAPVSAKSLLLEVLSSISRRGWLTVNPTPAVLYRKIDRDRPTLCLDEMDNYQLDERRDSLAVLNSGYKPGVPVSRCSDRGELEEFDPFCPKAYAGLDERQLVPTLLSRSITIRMETKRPGDKVEMWIAPDVEPRVSDLRARCEAWAERNVDNLRGHRPDLVGLINRQAEVWWILLSIGELAGDEWTDRARQAARVLCAGGDETDQPSQQVQLLTDIRRAFGNKHAIFGDDLLAYLNGLEESPWGARRRGEGLDARGLAKMLRPFRIKSKTVRIGDETRKGYQVEWFEDAFARYLPPPAESVTSVTSVTSAPHSHAGVTDVTDVTDIETPPPDAEQGLFDLDPDPMVGLGPDVTEPATGEQEREIERLLAKFGIEPCGEVLEGSCEEIETARCPRHPDGPVSGCGYCQHDEVDMSLPSSIDDSHLTEAERRGLMVAHALVLAGEAEWVVEAKQLPLFGLGAP
jgi:Protein of unknown function (DUF3631)/Toprim-like